MHVRGRTLVAIALLAALLGGPLMSRPAAAAGVDYLDPTGHTLGGPIREYWESHGGLWLFGYPISEPYPTTSEDGRPIVAQYFERARLEYHPALDDTQYRVLGGRLGHDLTVARQEEPAFRPVLGTVLGCDYFAPTGHSLCAPFRDWWHARGGLPIFGYPISQAFDEDGHTVQYFERARFEYHPENAGTDWEVELGHLGVDSAREEGVASTGAFNTVEPVTTTMRVEAAVTTSLGGDAAGSLAAGTAVRVIDGPRDDRYLVSTPDVTGWVPFSALAWSPSPDPRSAVVEPLSSFDPRVAASTRLADAWLSVGVYDSATGRLYGGGSGGLIGSASMSKALLLAVALRQVEAGRFALEDVMGLLEPMIVLSDNDVPNDVWRMVGGDWGVSETLRDAGIEGIAIQDPWDWGQIAASGADWARFFALLGSGQILSPEHTALALGLMENVIGEHRWGASTPGPDRLAIGKNGWYLDEEPLHWRVASAGFVSARDGTPGVAPLVVVVVTQYPSALGEGWGIDIATDLTDLVVDHARLRWAGSYLTDRRELASLPSPLPPVLWTSGFHPVR